MLVPTSIPFPLTPSGGEDGSGEGKGVTLGTGRAAGVIISGEMGPGASIFSAFSGVPFRGGFPRGSGAFLATSGAAAFLTAGGFNSSGGAGSGAAGGAS